MVRLTPSFARTGPNSLWMSRSSSAPPGEDSGAPSPGAPSSFVLLIVAPAVGSPTIRSRRARAVHALQQLRRVPDLLVGRRLAVAEERGAVLPVERTLVQVDGPVAEARDELVDVGLGLVREPRPLHEPHRARVQVVD